MEYLKCNFNLDIYLEIKMISGIDLSSNGNNQTIEFVTIKLNIEMTHIRFAIYMKGLFIFYLIRC